MKRNFISLPRFPMSIRIAVLSFFVLALVCFLYFILKSKTLPDRNFFNSQLEFELPDSANLSFNRFLKKNNQHQVFKKGTINILFHKNQWIGRIWNKGISRQALFTVDNSRIFYESKNFSSAGLHFSIYNPGNSNLLYSIYVKGKNKLKNIFSRRFTGQKFYNGYVKLGENSKRKISIVFETRGQGIGAWVNPVFTRKKKKPRIYVIIMLDTLRYDHTSLYGYSRDTTPALGKLAQDGLMFSNVYSTTSWTYPAHVSLFSGLNLIEHQILDQKKKILDDYPLIAEIFQRNGFLTAAFTGGGFVSSIFGFHRGYGIYSNNPGSIFSPMSSKKVFRAFKKYAEKYWGRDMFFFLHTYQMHSPYNLVPKNYIGKFNQNVNRKIMNFKSFIKKKLKKKDKKINRSKRKKSALIRKFKKHFMPISEKNRQQLIDLYDASIFYADQVLVGGVINYLKQKGVYDESMIVVSSDHGEEFYDHGSWEHGHGLYNELIKIPLVIKYPGNKKKGIENFLTSITDISGMILRESGFEYDKNNFKVKIGEKERILPVFLPSNPLIKQILPKFSFVNKNYHYIFNIVDKEKLKFFDPPPANTSVYELYSTSDLKEKNNFYKRGSKITRMFKKLLNKYMHMIKKIDVMNNKRKLDLDKNLKKQLKSLGYLGK